jgi:redox-sensitive bicupin YhaK (pirin superfamily)
MPRTLTRVIDAVDSMDGAGVKLKRSLGRSPHARVDPFLLLDEFGSDDPDAYIAGFPSHPHRGFETVTYMLDGRMIHEDHIGNRGELTAGGVQWMTAGKGVIHSEMPAQEEGLMRGFQLWVNLPAARKMDPAAYQEFSAEQIPSVDLEQGVTIKVIAGRVAGPYGEVEGAVNGIATEPTYLDIQMPAGVRYEHELPDGHSVVLYPYEGSVAVPGDEGEMRAADAGRALVMSGEGSVVLEAGPDGARCLLIAAVPIGEPVVQYGPFVMNTMEQIDQALADYKSGRLTD